MKLILSLFVLPTLVAIADPHASWFEGEDEQKPLRQTAFSAKKASLLAKKTTEVLKITGATEIECKMSEEECLIAYQMLIDSTEFHAITKGQKIRLKEGRSPVDTSLWLTINVNDLEQTEKERIKVAVSNLAYDLNRINYYKALKNAISELGAKEIICQTRTQLEDCNNDLERIRKEKKLHPLIKNKTIILGNSFSAEEDTITLNINATTQKMIAFLKANQE